MKHNFLFIFLFFISKNLMAYDATRGALQNNPGLASYGYGINQNTYGYTNNSGFSQSEGGLPDKWGAVAFDRKANKGGVSVNMLKKELARKDALTKCGSSGCKIISTFKNGCVASAKGRSGKTATLFTEVSGNRGEAEKYAMLTCHKSKATSCVIDLPEHFSL